MLSGDTGQPQRDGAPLRPEPDDLKIQQGRGVDKRPVYVPGGHDRRRRTRLPQVRARYSIARMHWLDPSVEYTVRPEPNSAPA